MEISEDLLSLFNARLEERDDSYVIEVPKREVTLGDVRDGERYRVALLSTERTAERDVTPELEQRTSKQPVEKGEQRTVEIVDIGEQGDGIARVERGFVIIVPDTEMNELVSVEITDVRDTVGFAEVVERKRYYE